MARAKDPLKAGELVRGILAQHEARASTPSRATVRVFEAFRRLGPPVVNRCEPDTYKRGVLTLRVYGAVWMTELSFLEPEMRRRINRTLEEPLVERITFRGGAPRDAADTPPSPKLSAEQLAKVEALGALVARPEVRAAVMRAAARSLGRAGRVLEQGSGFERRPNPWETRKLSREKRGSGPRPLPSSRDSDGSSER